MEGQRLWNENEGHCVESKMAHNEKAMVVKDANLTMELHHGDRCLDESLAKATPVNCYFGLFPAIWRLWVL